MKIIPLEGTTLTLPELVKLVEDESEDIILTRNGQPLVSVKDLQGADWESTSLSHNPQFAAIIQQSRNSYQTHGGISLADLRDELGLETDQTTTDTQPSDLIDQP
jgi:hypothetical protein